MARTNAQRTRAGLEAQKRQKRAEQAGNNAHRKAPAAPRGLGAHGRSIWAHTWTTCPWLGDVHRTVVLRLAQLEDERQEIREAIRVEGRTVMGSRGQPVQSPLLDTVRSVEVAISRTEKQLGISITSTRAATLADEALLAGADGDVAQILEKMRVNKTVH